jgi:hypothetical protein
VRREGIIVQIGFTATVNVQLQLATIQESVTVTGASPVVDVTSTTSTFNVTQDMLQTLPNARDIWSVMGQSPGIRVSTIDVGGSRAGTQTGFEAFGFSGQVRVQVDGVNTTEGTGAAGFYYDYGSFDEVSVATGTNTAEMPWPGVMSQFIAKSGGNTYHGKIYADYETEKIQSRNIDAAQVATGLKAGGGLQVSDLNRLTKYYDLPAATSSWTNCGGTVRSAARTSSHGCRIFRSRRSRRSWRTSPAKRRTRSARTTS